MQGVSDYNSLLEEEKNLLSSKATYDEKTKQLGSTKREIDTAEADIRKLTAERTRTEGQITDINSKLAKSEEIQIKVLELEQEKAELDELEKSATAYDEQIKLKGQLEADYNKAHSDFSTEYTKRKAELANLEKRAELLKDSGCIAPEAANCKFLKDAIEANSRIESYKAECTQWHNIKKAELQMLLDEVEGVKSDIEALGYNPEAVKAQRAKVRSLEPYSQEAAKLDGYQASLKLLEEQLSGLNTRIDELNTKVQELKAQQETISKELATLDESVKAYNDLQVKILAAKKWLDLEKQLPAAKEQIRMLTERLGEIEVDIKAIDDEVDEKEKDLATEIETASDVDKLQTEFNEAESRVKEHTAEKERILIEIDSLKQKLTGISETKIRIEELKKRAAELSGKVVLCEELKKAFNQAFIRSKPRRWQNSETR